MPQAEWPIAEEINIQQFTLFVLRTPVVIAHSTIVNSQKEFLSDFEFAVYFFWYKSSLFGNIQQEKYGNLLQVIKENYRTFDITSGS